MARLANQMKQLYAMCATALVMGRADLDGADDVGFDIELPIFTVCLLYTSDAADEL